MTHRTFTEMGVQLAQQGWGHDDGGNFKDCIKNMPVDKKSLCLLAAAVDILVNLHDSETNSDNNILLKQINTSLKTLAAASTTSQSDCVADGMLEWVRFHTDPPLSAFNWRLLPPFARRVLRVLYRKHKRRSDVTLDVLRSIHGCGPKTASAIMKWLGLEQP